MADSSCGRRERKKENLRAVSTVKKKLDRIVCTRQLAKDKLHIQF
jgi:hypothetical protein